MKVVAAYLLAILGGNASPSAADVKNILASVGAEGDDERIDFLLSEVKGKDIVDLIATGREKLASVPAGGGGGGVAVAATGGGGGATPAAAESKKEEKVEEKEESDDRNRKMALIFIVIYMDLALLLASPVAKSIILITGIHFWLIGVKLFVSDDMGFSLFD
ncbi:hypothetical protein ACFE04_003425 [Oxalis oulophora]